MNAPQSGITCRLGELGKGARCTVLSVGSGESGELSLRLMEMGILEGSLIEILHEAPFGKDPIAIRVRDSIIALRRHEANAVWVNHL